MSAEKPEPPDTSARPSPAVKRVFLDTEFTQFRDGKLLSMGLVSDCEQECYVELNAPARHQRASDFCKNVVLPQFGLVPGSAVRSDAEAGERVACWLLAFGQPVQVCFDYKLDWHFFEVVMREAGRWVELSRLLKAVDIAGVAAEGSAGEAAQDAVFQRHSKPGRHHALVDARALRAAFIAHDAALLPRSA